MNTECVDEGTRRMNWVENSWNNSVILSIGYIIIRWLSLARYTNEETMPTLNDDSTTGKEWKREFINNDDTLKDTVKSKLNQDKGLSCPICDVSSCGAVLIVEIEIAVCRVDVVVNCVELLFSLMSDADSQLQAPRSPLEGDDSVSLTEEQIQHVWIEFVFYG